LTPSPPAQGAAARFLARERVGRIEGLCALHAHATLVPGERIKHLHWHGNVHRALEELGDLTRSLDGEEPLNPAAKKLLRAANEFRVYIRANRHFIPNYGGPESDGPTTFSERESGTGYHLTVVDLGKVTELHLQLYGFARLDHPGEVGDGHAKVGFLNLVVNNDGAALIRIPDHDVRPVACRPRRPQWLLPTTALRRDECELSLHNRDPWPGHCASWCGEHRDSAAGSAFALGIALNGGSTLWLAGPDIEQGCDYLNVAVNGPANAPAISWGVPQWGHA
jgi:hypothetical protein